jgi:hypothetical protein
MKSMVSGGLLSAVFYASLFLNLSYGQNFPVNQHVRLGSLPDTTHFFNSNFLWSIDEVNGRNLGAFVSILAGDSMEGRASGTKGFERAASLATELFRRNNFKTYSQKFKIDSASLSHRIFSKEFFGDSIETKNIVAVWPGSDSLLRNEFVVVTAHLDHLGKKQDSTYHGANDNASGVSVIMALAEFIHKNKLEPGRTLVFILFSGEEAGLKGSLYFVEHPMIDLRKVRLQINLDLVGSGKNGLMLQGTEHFPQEEIRIKQINDTYFHFEIGTRPNSPNSDHYFFNLAGVPAFFIYAYNGTMPYHSPGDTSDKIDAVVLENVTKFVFMNVWQFAN